MVESLTDAEIAEVKASASAFHDVEQRTEPLRKFLNFWHALKWLDLDEDEKQVLDSALDGSFGQPLIVLAGFEPPQRPADLSDAMLASIDALRRMSAAERATARITKSDLAAIARDFRIMGSLVDKAHALAAEQRFLHWQIAFPGVWRSWTSAAPEGGFDAVIGNPPWDRMKMQEVEWFAARAPTVAKQARAADRKTKIAEMKAAGDQLIPQYERAAALAERAMRLARKSGDYPLLSKGDINIYALFVERAQALIKPAGMAGLLVRPESPPTTAPQPSSDKSLPPAACGACSILRTGAGRGVPLSFQTWTAASSSAPSCAAARSARRPRPNAPFS